MAAAAGWTAHANAATTSPAERATFKLLPRMLLLPPSWPPAAIVRPKCTPRDVSAPDAPGLAAPLDSARETRQGVVPLAAHRGDPGGGVGQRRRRDLVARFAPR